MRIVAGRFKGHAISGPRSMAVRPTSDRLRETLFNVLAHGYGLPEQETRVLDLFAGTGALGLEAMSRGARYCLFVDEGLEARALIRTNTEALGLGGQTRLFKRDATRLGPAGPIQPFDLIFCDPPYARGLAEKALASAAGGGWLAPGALVVIEEAGEVTVALPKGFEALDTRDYGESQLVLARFA
jgi:16S rRNA (guanine966-N2)-methyltransferase